MKNIQKYIGAALLGTAMLAVPSCSDTWDDHYGVDQEVSSASKSLWDLISENPKLSRFKTIAEKASYYRDETHPQADYTFKDMLNGSLLLTLWAPENDAFTEADYQQWLDMAETRGYAVQQQLLANTISLWRNVATGGGIDTLIMLNGKKFPFDKDNFTMSGVPMYQDQMNIAATNGTLHVLQGQTLPFHFNLYEYLKDKENAAAMMVNRFHDYLVECDTTYFSEANSVEGNPDINGNPTYVDSVYFTTNTLLQGTHRFPEYTNTDQYLTYQESFGANLKGEDSIFIMLLPSDAAWQAAYQKLEGYYNYAKVYANKAKMEGGDSKAIKLPLYGEINTDSLKEMNINMDIISPICFNLNAQPNADGKKGRWKLDDFLATQGAEATFFINTFGDTLRSDDEWQKESLFNGQQVEVSNGVGFVTSEWKMPRKLYKPDLIIEVGYQSFYNLENALKDGSPEYYAFNNATAEEWIDTVGRVTNNNFYYLNPKTVAGSPKFEFRLVGTDGENMESEVMSGKYDIGVVMVPDFYRTSGETVEGDTIKHHIKGTLSYNDGNRTDGKDVTKESDLKDYDGEKVDTLWLFEDFVFPVSYKNMRQTYPTLQISSKSSSTERKNGYSNAFGIDRIILRSKD